MVRGFHTFEVHDLPQDTRYLWSGIKSYVKTKPLTLRAYLPSAANDNEYDIGITDT
jgi:hypothetical protein